LGKYVTEADVKQLKQFGKSTCHPPNFGKKEKQPPTVWQTNLSKIETWQNSPLWAHISARGSWLPSSFRWEGEKRNKEYKRVPDVRIPDVS
jgi:hypothetical protein